MGAAGAIAQGEAAADAAGRQAEVLAYQAQVARNNETIANQMAEAEVQAGIRAAEMESLKTAAKVAKVRTGFAARNVDVNTGSAVDVQASERELGKINTETELSNAQQRAYGYRSRAANYRATAGVYGAAEKSQYAAADDARMGGYFKAAGTLLSNANSFSKGYDQLFGGSGTSGGQSVGAIYSGPI